MRKLIFGLMAILAMSCSKDNENNIKDDTLYNIEFKVSNFSTEIVPMTKIGQTTDGDTCSYLLFVYNQSEELVSEQKILNIDSATYNFNVQLPKGDYTIVAVGFNDYVDSLHVGVDNYKGHYIELAEFTLNFINNFHNDYFYNKLTLNVSGDITKNIQLSRITGRLELNIIDIEKTAIYDFDFVEIATDSVACGIYITDGSRNRWGQGVILTKDEWLRYKNKSIVFNVMPFNNSCVHIILKKGNIKQPYYAVKVKDFTGVIPRFGVYPNKKTIITGKLMPDITDNGFNLSFDTSWGESNNVNF